MPTEVVCNQKLQSQVQDLRREVVQLRSVLIGLMGRDQEGSYHPKFVRGILAATKEAPTREFTDPDSFWKQLAKV